MIFFYQKNRIKVSKYTLLFSCLLTLLLVNCNPKFISNTLHATISKDRQKQSIANPIINQPKDKKVFNPLTDEKLIQVAILLPLTGSNSDLGQQLLEGIEWAIFHYGTNKLVLRIYDTQAHRLITNRQSRQAIADGASIIIGPLFSHTSEQAMIVAKEYNVPVISFSNNLDLITSKVNKKNDKKIVFGISPKEELKPLIAVSNLVGYQRLALIAPNNAYGQQLQRTIKELLSDTNIELTRSTLYNPDSFDYTQSVQKISDYNERHIAYKEQVQLLHDRGIESNEKIKQLLNYKETFGPLPFDAVIIAAASSNTLRTIAAQMEFFEVDTKLVKLMGLRQWQYFDQLEHESALHHAWFSGLDTADQIVFNKHFFKLYKKPPSVLTALAFDLMSVLIYAERHALKIPQDLWHEPNDFKGSLGRFSFCSDGSVARKMVIYQITEKGSVVAFDTNLQVQF